MRLPAESLHVQLCCPEIMKQYVAALLHQVDLLSFFLCSRNWQKVEKPRNNFFFSWFLSLTFH